MFSRDQFLKQSLTFQTQTSLESVGVELEHVFYGKLKDPGILDNLDDSVLQIQWDVRINHDDQIFGTIRAREIDGEKYVLCIKRKVKGEAAAVETEQNVDQDVYNAIRSLASSGMRKRRYTFKVPDSSLMWELDVFEDIDGNRIDWVKLDLEIEDVSTEIPAFPVELVDVVDPRDSQRIKDLLDNVITLKRPS